MPQPNPVSQLYNQPQTNFYSSTTSSQSNSGPTQFFSPTPPPPPPSSTIPQQPFSQQQQQSVPFFNPLQASANNLFSDPVASMAVKYGSSLADQGKDYVTQNVDKWFALSKLKYYFAVDTTYVAKKLTLLAFPFRYV